MNAMVSPFLSSNPIRVLHIAGPGPLYGAERWILALIKAMDNTQVESIISVIDDGRNAEAELCFIGRSLGFKCHVFKAHGRLSLRAIIEIRNFIILNNIHILHTHWYKPDIIGVIASIGTGCKLVSTPHGWSRNADLKLRIYEALGRFAYLFFDCVAPLSKDIDTGLIKLPGLRSKLQLIENGVDLDEIEHALATNKTFPQGNKRFVIGYMGQLIARKGVDVLIRAIADLKGENIQLVIIGSGPEEQSLKKLAEQLDISGNIDFLGFHTDRLDFLKTFDLFVLPSRQEGIPRAVMEAMGMGIPVIVSNIPGCTDLVCDGINGLIFKVDDYHDLSARIKTVVKDQCLREKIARKGQENIYDNFSSKLMAKGYLKLYSTLLEN